MSATDVQGDEACYGPTDGPSVTVRAATPDWAVPEHPREGVNLDADEPVAI